MSLKTNDLPEHLKDVERVRFGAFEADFERRELRRSGVRIKLPEQPFSVLELLVRRAGRVVTREEIREEVWGSDTFVDYEQGINVAVGQIRSALDDKASSPRFVETVPRKGYRFVAPVEVLGDEAEIPPGKRFLPRISTIAAGLSVLALLVAWGAWLWSDRSEAALDAVPEPKDLRVLVLPFEDWTAEDEAPYLGDGLTEELITELSRRYGHQMGVIARTTTMRYRGATRSVSELARELRITHVVEGSVRQAGDRLRVTAQLIRAADEEHLWAGTYDRDLGDVLALQSEVAGRIAQALELQLLTRETPAPSSATARAEAVEAYLRAREILRPPASGRSLADGEALLRQALETDPGFTPAWVQLAQLHRSRLPVREHVPQAKAALERALALDDASPTAHNALAHVRFYYDWDFDQARKEWQRALQENPAYAEAHHGYAAWFSVHGRHAEALAEVERALELDPLSPAVASDVGWYSYFARRPEEAVERSLETLERIDPRFFWSERLVLLAARSVGREDEAVRLARREILESGYDGRLPSDPEVLLDTYWRHRLEMEREQVAAGRLSPAFLATTYMMLDRPEDALDALEEAYRRRSGWILPFLGVHPLFEPLRDDPRFQDLLERIGVPTPPPATGPRPGR